MTMEKGPDGVPAKPAEPSSGRDAHYRLDLYALQDFQENEEGSEALLFTVLAERIRNGTIHHHAELMDYLASACDAVANGRPPHEAFGFDRRGRKKKGLDNWLRCAYEVTQASVLSDLPLDEIYPIVAEKVTAFGIPLGVESVKKHYKNHKAHIPKITRENVHERLCWIDGRYVTATGIRSKDLGAFAQQFEMELFERVKKEANCLP